MILTKSNKPLCVIGIAQSTITQEGLYFFPKYWKGEIILRTPEEFIEMSNKDDYQYLVFFTLDVEKRIKIINLIENMKLDCFSVIHETVVIYKDLQTTPIDELLEIVGHGTVISPYSTVLINSKIGKHCLIETYCLVSHYVELGDNVILHSGTMIAGRTKIGENSVFNFKSSALNALSICAGTEVGAMSNVTKDITVPGRYIGTIARYAGDKLEFKG
jgi:acyl-[acyl carrier protein]--UDP-N-acetylglucosamine O-acyltransferase